MIPDKHQNELDTFPPVLAELVYAELASGNSIVEIGHSFPAPPSGAFVALARQVSTRPRSAGGGLSFRARNSAISSGEFTDAERRYFVIEPPVETPAPDMDAIRRQHDGMPDAVTALSERPAVARPEPTPMQPAAAAGVEYLVHFRDARAFHEIQCLFESRLLVLFSVGVDAGMLRARANANVNGAQYAFVLQLESAGTSAHAYSLRITGSWAHFGAEYDDYFRGTSKSWCGLWTRNLVIADSPRDANTATTRYRELSDAALRAASEYRTVAEVQQAILAALRSGAKFVSSNKEGNTVIAWRHHRFMRVEDGENPGSETYADEATFLTRLEQFHRAEITRNASDGTLAALDAWKLILRRLQRGA
ncbi:MAG TPA: hypothetical protein VE869_13235 [Gemmatimonas sp.]|nr:hypothetical protein [Gemmatimonas sp.]